MFTREMQKFVNLSALLLSGHSGAGNVALKMKRGAMGSSPLTSGGKKSPHLNADLTNKKKNGFRGTCPCHLTLCQDC